MVRKLLKKILPPFIFSTYHWLLAVAANIIYWFPSRRLIVIGVTGTKGKSTVCNMIWQVLTVAGYRVGMTTTANIRIKDTEWVNSTKMTMQGRFKLQRLLRQMVTAGCQYAIIETSSEGIKQHRHVGIRYQVAVLTNLSPEHIEAHGSFTNYRAAKAKLFQRLTGQRISILNRDDEQFDFFKSIPAKKYIYYGLHEDADLQAEHIVENETGFSFFVKGHRFNLPLLGKFNVLNALAAIAAAKSQEVAWHQMSSALAAFSYMPGRMEEIKAPGGFSVFVDYAHTPESLELVYQSLQPRAKQLVAVLGSCGGGRDKAKRPLLGKLAGQYARVVFVTNEDPYDEDPEQIIEEVFAGVKLFSSAEAYKIRDRREAIAAALKRAAAGDIVVITGKGSEQAIVTDQGKQPWDDRRVVRELLGIHE